MKNTILMIAFFMGLAISANAQSAQKKTVKPNVSRTQKKVTPTKQAAELKSTTAYNANASLVLAMPRMEADTTGLPAVRN